MGTIIVAVALLVMGIMAISLAAEEEHTVLLLCGIALVIIALVMLVGVGAVQDCTVITADTTMVEGKAQTTLTSHCKATFDTEYHVRNEVIVFEPMLPIGED